MGIALKILSGDNPATVGALARGVGLQSTDRAVSGLDLKSDEDLESAADTATVFGRLSPSQKESIIAALRRRGHYVAMIGDGVNDVLALKQSQVAISMRTGSPVTRSVADIILLDDSFTALPTAFSEGRRIRGGMEQIIRLFLVRTISVSLMILGAALLSTEFPLTPRHTAILSTLTVGVPALFVAAWARPARTDTYLLPAATVFVLPAAVTLALTCLTLYKIEIGREGVDVARTVLTTAAVLAGVLVITFVDDPRPRWMTLQGLVNPLRSALLAAAMLCGFAVAMAVPLLRRFYELELLDARQWLFVAVGVAAWALVLRPIWRLVDRVLASRGAAALPPAP
jgi:cation-transporting ATPase E